MAASGVLTLDLEEATAADMNELVGLLRVDALNAFLENADTPSQSVTNDHRIKILDAGDQGNWVETDVWKAHDSAIVKLSWAHPEYGQVLASCSFDRSVKIWEEQEQVETNTGRRWAERAKLTESKASVQSVLFAPNHLGLKLASVAADGFVRIYEAIDLVNLSDWTLMDEFAIFSGTSKEGLAIKDLDGPFCLSWCTSRLEPQMVVAGCGRDNTARICRVDANNKWQPFESLPGHTDVVTDVAWAPAMGRSYHLIATSCKDGHIRIFKLTDDSTATSLSIQGGQLRKRFQVDLVADFLEPNCTTWRISWNITGTILSSSGDNGKIRLWKFTCLGEWKQFALIDARSDVNPKSAAANNANQNAEQPSSTDTNAITGAPSTTTGFVVSASNSIMAGSGVSRDRP